MTMKIGYLEVVEVKKIRSRSVCQLIVEADISQFKSLVQLDEMKGVFIPCEIEGAICGAMDLDLDPKELETLMKATTKGDLTIEHDEETPKGEKSLAQRMVIDGYFRNPELWDAMEENRVYTQKQHKAHVLSLPTVNINPNLPGTGDVVAHHVRTAANSGTGIKPKDWYCIPIHDSHHKWLHSSSTRADHEAHMTCALAIVSKAMRAEFKAWLRLDTMSGFTLAQLAQAEDHLGICTAFYKSMNK